MMFLFRTLLLIVFLGGAAFPGLGAPTPSPSPAKVETPAPSPTPPSVPLSEIVAQGDATEAKRREIETGLLGDPIVATVDAAVSTLSREIDAGRGDGLPSPTLEMLPALEAQWVKTAETLTGWKDGLSGRAKWLDTEIARLSEMEALWSGTKAVSSDAPPEVLQRVDKLITSIKETRKQAGKQREAVLKLQTRVAEQDARVAEVLTRLKQARNEAVRSLFVKEGVAIWSVELRPAAEESLAQQGQNSFSAQFTGLKAYVEKSAGRFVLHALVFAILFGVLLQTRQGMEKMAGRMGDDPALQRVRSVAEMPAATALVLSMLASPWIYLQPPRLFLAFAGAASLIPAILILRRLIVPSLYPILNVLIGFFIFDTARDLVAALPLLSRGMFLSEMFAGLLFALLLLRRSARSPEADGFLRHAVRYGARIALAVFAAAFLANAFGYVRLSMLVGNALLGSFYLAVVFSGLVAIGDGILMWALCVPPLKGLGMVRRYRPLLWERSRRILRWAIVLLWGWLTIRLLSLNGVVAEKIGEILKAKPGADSFLPSLRNVLDFGLTVWATFLLSKFIRFVLEEDVYPRVRLSRGLPYAISTVLHYAVLLLGFFLAVAMLGVDLTKVTILAGAFGVGLGFGLQNIVNNFVSGLILLFERPVNVGDVVQIGDSSGVVNQIGIRASVIRTSSGSEIIVPNGTLLSDRVTNWTRSNRQRGMEIAVNVMPGCDPACVIDLLRQVAAAHPRVADHPAPNAYFLKMSPAAFEFEVRAWTNSYEEWFQIRSELTVALHEALRKEGVALAPAPATPAVVK